MQPNAIHANTLSEYHQDISFAGRTNLTIFLGFAAFRLFSFSVSWFFASFPSTSTEAPFSLIISSSVSSSMLQTSGLGSRHKCVGRDRREEERGRPRTLRPRGVGAGKECGDNSALVLRPKTGLRVRDKPSTCISWKDVRRELCGDQRI